MTDFFDDTEARRQARKKRDWELTKEQSQRLLAWEPPPRYRPLRASTSAQPQRENAAGVTNVTPDPKQRAGAEARRRLDEQFPDHEDDAFTAWQKGMPTMSEKERRARSLGDSAVTAAMVNSCIAKAPDHLRGELRGEFTAAIDQRHELLREAISAALAQLVGEIEEDARAELAQELKGLRIEIATLESTVQELRRITSAQASTSAQPDQHASLSDLFDEPPAWALPFIQETRRIDDRGGKEAGCRVRRIRCDCGCDTEIVVVDRFVYVGKLH
jgi:hypothetical protein